MLEDGTDRVDPLSFDFPAWGDGGSAGHLGLSDALFLVDVRRLGVSATAFAAG